MRPRHLLIVDDNKADIFLIREALDLAGVNAYLDVEAEPMRRLHDAQARAHGISPADVVRDVMLVHQARKEFVKVEELAALTVFLASDAAASTTATAIAMDGGWTQH